LKPVKSQNQ